MSPLNHPASSQRSARTLGACTLAAIINQASLKSTDRTRALITVTLTIYAFGTQAFIAEAVNFHGCNTSERFSLIACKPWTCIKRGRTSDTGAKHVRSEDSHNQHPTMVLHAFKIICQARIQLPRVVHAYALRECMKLARPEPVCSRMQAREASLSSAHALVSRPNERTHTYALSADTYNTQEL
eukprot:6183172-Pleurochrysis_carterae.AAC.1